MITSSNEARARLRAFSAVLAAIAMLLVPARGASAADLTAAVEGVAEHSGGFGTCGNGLFDGTVTGLHGTTPAVRQPMKGTFTYCNPDYVAGWASGSFTVAGHSCLVEWMRVGVTVVMGMSGCHLHGWVAGSFVPSSVDPLTPTDFVLVGAGMLPATLCPWGVCAPTSLQEKGGR